MSNHTEVTACSCCRLVPLSYLSLDVAEPIVGWAEALAERGVEIVLDDIGRPSAPREVLGELIAEHREREARALEDQRRRFESVASPPPAGVPALADGSPYESLVAAGGVVLPSEEFGARPKPNFLVEELERDQRQQATARAEAQAVENARRVLDGRNK